VKGLKKRVQGLEGSSEMLKKNRVQGVEGSSERLKKKGSRIPGVE
jgi:hypothetical protein